MGTPLLVVNQAQVQLKFAWESLNAEFYLAGDIHSRRKCRAKVTGAGVGELRWVSLHGVY